MTRRRERGDLGELMTRTTRGGDVWAVFVTALWMLPSLLLLAALVVVGILTAGPP